MTLTSRLGFWIAPLPHDDDAACADLQHRLGLAAWASQHAGALVPPVPRISSFVDAAIEMLPRDPRDPRYPWAHPFPWVDAVADTFMPLLTAREPRTHAALILLAQEYGLRVFDPTAHRLLTITDLGSSFGLPLLTTPVSPGTGEPAGACRGLAVAREGLGFLDPGIDHHWGVLDAVGTAIHSEGGNEQDWDDESDYWDDDPEDWDDDF